ncbi:Gfo/Idh/MocA family oxidoreductase [Marivirga sp. S37H4]|uniref:Gfo/Idh/MocA family oxidoreductase n=1 Tax=Marivirga aurantiaca TaxID=2802615 RepID=A0A934WW38_9BACT|nr:Gfo/Idh/MocA family oxidoreductase [Marivirga aurantiaca]MBK6264049.1 Gfo/Idh/MocA family oxidoreductase [Marivirga aurantiaca]
MRKRFVKLDHENTSRRTFIRKLSMGIGATTLGLHGLSAMAGGTNPSPSPETLEKLQNGRKLGIALVGLGNYSRGQLAPALQETKLCKLSGIVTGSPEKIPEWKRKYNIADKNVYNYGNFENIKGNDDIDIIYIVLPNGMHAEYTIRAAQTGKHVICEKPMATSVEDCQRMIDACNKAGVKLSIGYRLHFEPHNLEMMRLGQNEVYGNVEKIIAEDGFRIGKGGWRLDKELAGGGPLTDVGIYCIQGAIYTKGEMPVSVTAQYHEVKNKEKFDEVEQGLDWQMQFKDGTVADCKTSYAENLNLLRAETDTNEWFELSPAYSYSGIEGETSKGDLDFKQVNQQALQMDDFADCIINNKKTPLPGEMGLRDVYIIYAIYEAADTGKRVSIDQNKKMLDWRIGD